MEQIWWKQVPNARLFISDVVESILSERSLILQYSRFIPWKAYLIESIKENVMQCNSFKRFETIENAEDNPGEYILRHFCKPEKRVQYRPSKSYAKFLAESNDIVLHDRYLWVKLRSDDELDKWQEFISEYLKERGKEQDCAVFILESESRNRISTKKKIKLFCYDDYTNEFDRNVFSSLAASTVNETPFIKHYLSELAANIAKRDIELCAECIRHYKEFLSDPYGTLCDIVNTELRSNGRNFEFPVSRENVDKLIWKTQIKTVYPVVEEYRENFVHSHEGEIERELPIQSVYGETYRNPVDVELGTLYYMSCERILALDYDEFKELELFKNIRNSLSHLGIIALEDIVKINDQKSNIYTQEINSALI